MGQETHIGVSWVDWPLARKHVHQVLLLEKIERFGCQVEFLYRPMECVNDLETPSGIGKDRHAESRGWCRHGRR